MSRHCFPLDIFTISITRILILSTENIFTCMGHYSLCEVSKKRQFSLFTKTKRQELSGYHHILSVPISGIIISAFFDTINLNIQPAIHIL